jgi:hypothetical protein
MDKEKYIQLTKDLYRLTVLFPKKDPLRYKMRELANNILLKPERKDVEALNSLFEVAKSQNWVTFSDLSTVQENYVILLKTLEEIKPEIKRQIITETVPINPPPLPNYNRNWRKDWLIDRKRY